MKNFKSFGTILLVLLFVLAATACGNGAAPPAETSMSSQQGSGSSGDTEVSEGQEGTLLPNGWKTEDFVVAGFSKDGPGDFGYKALLTEEEQKNLSDLLELESWEEAQPPEHGLTDVLSLSDEAEERFLIVYDGQDLGTLVDLRETSTGKTWLFSAPSQVCSDAKALAESLRERAEASSGEAAASAEIRFPELLPDAVKTSSLYKEALTRPSVILFQGQPVTSRTAADHFLKAAAEGKDSELYLYSFTTLEDIQDCLVVRFVSKDGKITESFASERSWDGPVVLDNSYAVTDISLNSYGYLVYQGESSSEPTGYQVVNDRDLYPDAQERQKMLNTYVDPIGYTALGNRYWDSPQELTQWVWLFEDLYRYENSKSPFDQYGYDWPVKDMLELLNRYFDGVTKEILLSDEWAQVYNADSDTIHYEGGRGGGPFCLRVTSWDKEGDLLSIHYENYDYVTGIPFEDGKCLLTVKLMDDGSFRYLSNKEDR